jgi:putative DNA primase/helicase
MEAMHSTTEHTVLAVHPHGIPQEFKDRPQWIVWKLEKRDAKLTKVPYSPWTGECASTNELMTWSSFEVAFEVYEGGGYQGVGFVFCSADPYVGIDLDNCRNPETGEVGGWAQKVVDSFKDVVLLEASPSGRGVHLITKGICTEGVNTKNVEIYGQGRYFTVTGVAL